MPKLHEVDDDADNFNTDYEAFIYSINQQNNSGSAFTFTKKK